MRDACPHSVRDDGAGWQVLKRASPSYLYHACAQRQPRA